MRRENLPVIPDDHLEAMRAVAKPVPDLGWRTMLTAYRREGAHLRGDYQLPARVEFGPVHGSLYLFTRVTAANPRDFSVGLAFMDDAGNGPYRLVRCNGFHLGPHTNFLEGEVIPPETPHIHTATERYTKARDRKHDGYAEATDAYSDLDAAIKHLSVAVHLVPDGMLLL